MRFGHVHGIYSKPLLGKLCNIAMRITCVRLYRIALQLKAPFKTSIGEIYTKNHILIEVLSENASGWGEAPALSDRIYSIEDDQTIFNSLSQIFTPMVLKRDFSDPTEISKILIETDDNTMAKASLEMACWDLYAKELNIPLYQALGGAKREIPSSGVIGIGELSEVEKKIELLLSKKYNRIKLKINRETSTSYLRKIKERFSNVNLSLDCNGCFDLDDLEKLKEIDRLNFCMVEQPFKGDKLSDIKDLKVILNTPICLDESMRTVKDLNEIIALNCCDIISIKPPCVGGHSVSKKLCESAIKAKLKVYCGGMFETGIGRAHNIALSTVSGFDLPAEISDHGTYYQDDVIQECLTLDKNGAYKISDSPGIGFIPSMKTITQLCAEQREFG